MTIIFGLPRLAIRSASSRTTRRPEIDVSYHCSDALARYVIDDVEHAKPPPGGELVVDEV